MTINLNRLGADKGVTGTYAQDNALFDDIFLGEIITAFEEANVTMDRHFVRTITEGKSATFPVTGKATAGYHTAGNKIAYGNINQTEKQITIDGLLHSSVSIYQLDELKAHYDLRSEYSKQLGRSLAVQMDKHVLQTVLRAARAAANLSELAGGSTIYNDDTDVVASGNLTDPDNLVKALYKAARIMDENDVPEEDRFFYCSPELYYKLVLSDKAINRDFGGNGSIASGKIFDVAGIEIVKTNHLPNTNITTGVAAGDSEARHAVDGSNLVGLVSAKPAVGTVKLMDLQTENEWDMDYQCTKYLAKMAVGHDVLRPECAIEILNTTTPE